MELIDGVSERIINTAEHARRGNHKPDRTQRISDVKLENKLAAVHISWKDTPLIGQDDILFEHRIDRSLH
jgi:hypothetical protein